MIEFIKCDFMHLLSLSFSLLMVQQAVLRIKCVLADMGDIKENVDRVRVQLAREQSQLLGT